MKKYKRLFSEFVVADISKLKQYIEMSDRDKLKSLLKTNREVLETSNIWSLFYWKADELNDDKLLNSLKLDDLGQIEDLFSAVDIIFSSNKYEKEIDKAISLIFKQLFSYVSDDTKIPAWWFFSKPEIIKNQWLIHFTNSNPINIAKNGFNNLTTDMNELGLTTVIKGNKRSKNGFGFAYLLSDYEKYGKKVGKEEWKYGHNAVLFRASGLRVWHKTDREFQTIFKGDTVTNIIPLNDKFGKGEFYITNKNNTKDLYKNKDINKVIDWLITNYRQYQKVL